MTIYKSFLEKGEMFAASQEILLMILDPAPGQKPLAVLDAQTIGYL